MNISKMLLLYCRNRSLSRTCAFFRWYSSEKPKTKEISIKEKISLSKPTPVKWKRPPFISNFFCGKFDVELLAFPEILDKDQVAELEQNVKIITDIMKEKVNSAEIDSQQKLPADLLQDLKELGLFGRLIPAKYGGLELSHTACVRLNEALSLDWSVCATLAAHEFFASQVLLQFGSEEQKNKYLPQLASGNLVAALCCSEFESGTDPLSMVTEAKLASDNHYELFGSKCWVTNAEIADLFVVFAKTPHRMSLTEKEISVFLVPRDSPAIEVVQQNKVCLRGTHSAIVNFNGVLVPTENLIVSEGVGLTMYLSVLKNLRFGLQTFTFGTLKALLDAITDRVIHNERLEHPVGDQQLVRRRIAKINNMIYGMESVSYFTAALVDSTENPETSLEMAAMKVFNSEGTLYCVRELMDLLGSSSLMQEFQLERFHRDAMGLAFMDGSNDIARLFISMLSFKAYGAKHSQDVLEMRNPFDFPKKRVKEMWSQYLIGWDRFKLNQDIGGHVHPSLSEWGEALEKSLQKFELVVRNAMVHHGNEISNTQIDPWKFAEIAINMYAMSAAMARFNRSYCIGLKNSHHELKIAAAFCYDAHTKINRLLNDANKGITYNNEREHLHVGTQVIDCKGYFSEHPLKHNF